MNDKTESIRLLNDQLRQNTQLGKAVITCGVAALGVDTIQEIVREIATYDDFRPENDTHGEHDFGMVETSGHRIFFKIDYFDKRTKPFVKITAQISSGCRCKPSSPIQATRGFIPASKSKKLSRVSTSSAFSTRC